MHTTTPGVACLDDLAIAAESMLPPDTWAYVEGGAGDEAALHGNTAALRGLRLVPRVLSGAGERRLDGRLLGSEHTLPLAIAPMAYQRLIHDDGEVASAWAAAEFGVPMIVPMLSSVSLERIVAETGAEVWFQLYWLRDRRAMAELVSRAEQAGAGAVVLTVDMPVMGRRTRDLRHSFALPPQVQAAHFTGDDTTPAHRRRDGDSALASHTAAAFDPSLSWADVTWLMARTTLPVVLKGILHPADARRAAEVGAAGIVVSNHGGRQLDRAVASTTVLPAVRAAVGDQYLVLADGGIRSGSDILSTLALGADGVLLGRPVLWGLAAGGGPGVLDVLGLLAAELDAAMAMTGCADVGAARGLDVVHETPPWTPAGGPR